MLTITYKKFQIRFNLSLSNVISIKYIYKYTDYLLLTKYLLRNNCYHYNYNITR